MQITKKLIILISTIFLFFSAVIIGVSLYNKNADLDNIVLEKQTININKLANFLTDKLSIQKQSEKLQDTLAEQGLLRQAKILQNTLNSLTQKDQNNDHLLDILDTFQDALNLEHMEIILTDGLDVLIAPSDTNLLDTPVNGNDTLSHLMRFFKSTEHPEYVFNKVQKGHYYFYTMTFLLNDTKDIVITILSTTNDSNTNIFKPLDINFEQINNLDFGKNFLYQANSKQFSINDLNDYQKTLINNFNFLASDKIQNSSLDNGQYTISYMYYKDLDIYIVNLLSVGDKNSSQYLLATFYILLSLLALSIIIYIIYKYHHSFNLQFNRLNDTLKESNCAVYDVNILNKNISLLNQISPDLYHDVYNNLKAIFINMAHSLELNVQEAIKQGRLDSKQQITMDMINAFNPNQSSLPTSKFLDISSSMINAKQKSGSFYNIIKIDESNIAIVAGSVNGNTLEHAIVANNIICSSSILLKQLQNSSLVLNIINNSNFKQHENIKVKLLLVIISEQSGNYQVASAGHALPLVLSAKNSNINNEQFIGEQLFSNSQYLTYKDRLGLGDSLIIYQDNIFEVKNPQGEHYSNNYLFQALGSCESIDSASLLTSINKNIIEFKQDRQFDKDICLISVVKNSNYQN